MHKAKTLWTSTCPRVAAVYRSACRACSSQAGSGSKSDKGKRNYATQAAAEPFLSGSSSVYVEEMYSAWQRDPNSVHKVSCFHHSMIHHLIYILIVFKWIQPKIQPKLKLNGKDFFSLILHSEQLVI